MGIPGSITRPKSSGPEETKEIVIAIGGTGSVPIAGGITSVNPPAKPFMKVELSGAKGRKPSLAAAKRVRAHPRPMLRGASGRCVSRMSAQAGLVQLSTSEDSGRQPGKIFLDQLRAHCSISIWNGSEASLQ